MDIPPSYQLQEPKDDKDQVEELEGGHNYIGEDAAFQESDQETLFSYLHQHFQQPQNFDGKLVDAHQAKWQDMASAGANSTASDHRKIPQKQEGYNSASPKLKERKWKAAISEVHGGRVVRSAGRKDRHSKVCTARGTRDRRVRLSPKTAVQFYDVQDRLGYDRPSKAIDWLMKEAKTAIDALDEPPTLAGGNDKFNAANGTENHISPDGKRKRMQQESGEVLKPERGTVQNLEHSNGDNPISIFGFFNNDDAPSPSTQLQANSKHGPNASCEAPGDSPIYPGYEEGLLSVPLTSIPSDIFDSNLEMARLQRILTWNSAEARGGQDYLASPVLGHNQRFFRREPLQSSVANYSPTGTQFPGITLSNEELPNFCGSGALM